MALLAHGELGRQKCPEAPMAKFLTLPHLVLKENAAQLALIPGLVVTGLVATALISRLNSCG